MSTQQILTVVGTVVGAYFGYPQLGFVVGSLAGAALTPAQKVEGPRIQDQKVTLSTEGTGIPRYWGNVRLGGNVVESTDKIETATRKKQGKGGGVKSTNYSYHVDMRTMLGETREGVTVAIRKIWQDGKLVYDASSGASLGSALASAESSTASLILYQGDEDQLPDPTEEARYGVGNVPAYRGVVSVVMNGIDCPGGRVPQFSFELCAGATVSIVKQQFATVENTVGANQQAIGFIQKDNVLHTVSDGAGSSVIPRRVLVSYGTPGAFVPVANYAQPAIEDAATNPPGRLIAMIGGAPTFLQVVTLQNVDSALRFRTVFRVDARSGDSMILSSFTQPDDGPSSFGIEAYRYAAVDEGTGDAALVPFEGSGVSSFVTFTREGTKNLARPSMGYGPVAMVNGELFMMNLGGTLITRLDPITGAELSIENLPGTTDTLGPRLMSVNGSDVYALVMHTSGGGLSAIFKRQGAVWVPIVTDLTIGSSDPQFMRTFFTDDRLAIIGPNLTGSTFSYDVIRLNGVSIEPANVGDIIRDECDSAGLASDQFDVSTITETVHGYTLANPSSARNGVQQLLTAFAIDATDEDERLPFFNRSDKTSLSIVPYDDLGCVEDGAEPGDPMPLTRANVTELYRSVTVSYINPDFDYQTSTEIAQRQISGATTDFSTELAIAMTSDQAATAAHRILYDNHNERNRRSMRLSRKYACYSAGDVLTVEYPRGTLSDWRLVQMTDTGSLIEADVVPADAALYAQTAVGGVGYEGQEVSPLPSLQRLLLIDGPLLQDSDNNAGIYAAMEPFSGSPGAELFVGLDDASLESRGTVDNAATIGFAESALGPWTSVNVDPTNTIIVAIGEGELNSTTFDLLTSSDVNAFAIGANGRWEYAQFLSAASLGAGRYLLSGFVRGIQGTQHNRGNHAVGDSFVLLGLGGTLRPNLGVGALGSSASYRAITKGRSLSSDTSTVYANTGEGLRPLSPVFLRRSNANDLSVDRRSRLSMNFSTGSVPLGEATEAYLWKFYTSSAYTTLIGTTTTTTSTITAAQQTAIGVTPSATAYVRVAQLSDTVGAGHELEATA